MTAPALRGIRRDSPLPYYEQLKQVIVEQIDNGTYPPGSLLPSEWELCDLYGVSRTVVRQALGDLGNEGKLHRRRGKGTFVAERPHREQFIESTVGYFEDLPSNGGAVRRKVLSTKLADPSPTAAQILGLAPGVKIVQVDRQRYVGGEIGSYTQHYLPTRLHPDLLGAITGYDLESHSLYTFMDEVCGILVRSGHRTVEAAATSHRLAKLLELPPGAPVLYICGVGRDLAGRPVEMFEAWHRGDRTQIEIEVAGPTRSAGIVEA